MNDDPLTVAGAATVLVPFGSSAPCSLLIPSTSRVGEPSVPVNVEPSRRSRREATFVSAHATGSCRGNAQSRMGIMLYHYICQRRLVLEVALGGGEDSTSAGRAPMKAATAEDLAFENASRQCSAIDRRRDPPSAALPVRRGLRGEELEHSIVSAIPLAFPGIAVGPFRIGFARCLSAARPLAYAPLGLRLPLDVLDLPRKPQAPAVPTGPAAAVAGLRASGRGAWLRRARAQSRYKVRRVDGYRQHEADRREHVGGECPSVRSQRQREKQRR